MSMQEFYHQGRACVKAVGEGRKLVAFFGKF
jgi:hypothetical protein